jgi:hypothetical protein
MCVTRTTACGLLCLSLGLTACGLAAPAEIPELVTPAVALPAAWTATPALLFTPEAGWSAIVGTDVQLWLPESYHGGDPATHFDELLTLLDSLPPEYDLLAESLRQNPNAWVFLALDASEEGSVVEITRKENAPPDLTAAAYLEGAVPVFENEVPGTSVLDQGLTTLGGESVGWLVLEITTPGSLSRQLSYAFVRPPLIWTVSFAVAAEDFEAQRPMFEKSVLSFRVLE